MSNFTELKDSTLESISKLESDLSSIDPASQKYVEVSQEYAAAQQLMSILQQYQKTSDQLEDLLSMGVSEDEEMAELIGSETELLQKSLLQLEKELKRWTQPELPNDKNPAIIEIRAGTGGTEASMFADELMRMYTRYCNGQNWKVEVLSINYDEQAGIKSAILEIHHKGAFGRLRFESGVHRVQRVPATESSGRIHTSAASVAVLPSIETHEIEIAESDLKIDVYRSSGPGGQSVNTTDSAVRITHIPSGITVTCQDQKSQLKNKDKAMSILASKLYAIEQEKQMAEITAARNMQIKSGDRSEKIRTYNFQQSRITDHRAKKSWFNIQEILDGNLDDVIDTLQDYMRSN